ncbi:hypothetical protein EIP91_007042 [Steccherinum ochraceum]|uniref:Methyltransferase domain-containing protein n=1 Tax=Steccherinum ochraceum TaxID=92696 RepID=A0A4R0RJ67_9APHY|nr:hypothetical protein EIP91_007042 [Steccherinum ochraceum]
MDHRESTDQDADNLAHIVAFLQRKDVETCFAIHPNRLASADFVLPSDWSAWWGWAGSIGQESKDEPWLNLWRYSVASLEEKDLPHFLSIPQELKTLVDIARQLQLPRSMIHTDDTIKARRGGNSNGMSPKKEHEVERMVAFISERLRESSNVSSKLVHRAIDIGAGQAYLSRALRDRLHFDVLALDWSDVQYRGAVKKENPKGRKRTAPSTLAASAELLPVHRNGSLDYKTVDINSTTLLRATTDWLESTNSDLGPRGGAEQQASLPVLLVALHACGSLTLDIFRALTQQLKLNSAQSVWTPRLAVIVGCCYNMLRPEDRVLQIDRSNGLVLTANHLQLAAQTPDHWGLTAHKLLETSLAIRKVAWRGLLEGLLLRPDHDHSPLPVDPKCEGGSQFRDASRRLGRLNDAAYADWDKFLAAAQQKLGVHLGVSGTNERDAVLA